MKAITQRVYGSVGVLELSELPMPIADEKEVVVKVEAAGVDVGVWHFVSGRPLAMRLAGFGVREPKNPVPGQAFAGRVVEVGSGVTSFSVGDAVYGVAQGAFAEFARARVKGIALMPAGLTPQQAAALPISATTALKAVRDVGHVESGQRVLVFGAGGGVGSFAVQIALAFGAEVTGVCSTGKMEFVRLLGAKEVVDYTCDDLARFADQFDLVVDTGGGRSLRTLRRLLTRKGTLVIVGAEGIGGPLLGGADRGMRAQLLSLFVPQRMTGLLSIDKTENLNELAKLITAGKVSPAVGRVFSLSETVNAIKYVESRQSHGKVVISI